MFELVKALKNEARRSMAVCIVDGGGASHIEGLDGMYRPTGTPFRSIELEAPVTIVLAVTSLVPTNVDVQLIVS